MNRCDCEHWEICPTCFPQGYDDDGNRKLVEVPPKRAELVERIAALEARNSELERLCDATYVAQGADAYNHACDELERWQSKRRSQGKDAGTEGSLCDGMAWLYGHVDALEAENARLAQELFEEGRRAENAQQERREAKSTIAKQAEQLAAAEKDAERYRWLRDNGHGFCEFSVSVDEDGIEARGSRMSQIPEMLDAAIDAAIAAREGKS